MRSILPSCSISHAAVFSVPSTRHNKTNHNFSQPDCFIIKVNGFNEKSRVSDLLTLPRKAKRKFEKVSKPNSSVPSWEMIEKLTPRHLLLHAVLSFYRLQRIGSFPNSLHIKTGLKKGSLVTIIIIIILLTLGGSRCHLQGNFLVRW